MYGVSKEHHQRDQKRGKIYQYDMEQAEFQFFPVGCSLKETSNANMAGGGWGVGGQKWPKIFWRYTCYALLCLGPNQLWCLLQ